MKPLHLLPRFIYAFSIFITSMLDAHAEWTVTGAMHTNRYPCVAALLSNGRVLVEGETTAAELFDFATGLWTATGSMNAPRAYHQVVTLANGKVLIAGGYFSSNTLTSAEVYDPSTEAWTTTGSLNAKRSNFTATLLPNGKALVTGGNTGNGVNLASAELYDPATGIWTLTGAMNAARGYHTATLLPNGKVLVVGGFFPLGDSALSSAELYDPATGTWATIGSMNSARGLLTATLLPNGKVLVAGGMSAYASRLASAEICDPETGTWTPTGSLNISRSNHTATLLPNGNILAIGGAFGSLITDTCDVYDPMTGTWTQVDSLNIARSGHSATILPSGYLLVAGGDFPSGNHIASAEILALNPPIASQPADASVLEGRTASFSVIAGGSNLSYQWKKNGTNIDGAIQAILKIRNTKPADMTNYAVVITSLTGSVTSNPAALTVIPDADGDGLSDDGEINTYHTNPNKSDTDNDGISDYGEIHTYNTNPLLADTDGDGFLDGYEVLTGKSPLDLSDKPALVAEARTAIEFTFSSALGKTYRIEDSVDLTTWKIVESGIAGNGSVILRFYSTRGMPLRYFRVEEDAP